MFRFLLIITVIAASPLVATEEIPSQLDTAARKYRLNVYATYRSHRNTYDEMIQTGQSVMTLWEKNQNRRNTKLVTDWFNQARKAARTFGSPLPPSPKIEPVVRPKKDKLAGNTPESSLSVRWPSSPKRKRFTDSLSSKTRELAFQKTFLLTKQSRPLDLSGAEFEFNSFEEPTPAYSVRYDPKRREFGSSIDLNMLIARIESENLRLKLLEERLNQDDFNSTSKLKLVAAEFAQIANNRRLTELYWSNLGQNQKRIAPRPLSLKTIETRLNHLLEDAPNGVLGGKKGKYGFKMNLRSNQ